MTMENVAMPLALYFKSVSADLTDSHAVVGLDWCPVVDDGSSRVKRHGCGI